MLNELWAAEEAQAAAVISKVRCSFSLGWGKRTAPHLSDRLCVEEVKGGRLR